MLLPSQTVIVAGSVKGAKTLITLFGRSDSTADHRLLASNVNNRALSVAVVDDDFVKAVYAKVSVFDDLVFGATLHAGRLKAIQRLPIRPDDRILEIGVGTGINACLYPSECSVTGIDFSPEMLKKADRRIATHGVRNVRLMQMDAAHLDFPDDSFDIVYAPYVISVVPDPVRVAREMHRVCRVGGHIVVLNHFRSQNRFLARAEQLLSPLTVHVGFKADLDLPGFLAQAKLDPISIEKVNIPPIWSLVTCRKEAL